MTLSPRPHRSLHTLLACILAQGAAVHAGRAQAGAAATTPAPVLDPASQPTGWIGELDVTSTSPRPRCLLRPPSVRATAKPSRCRPVLGGEPSRPVHGLLASAEQVLCGRCRRGRDGRKRLTRHDWERQGTGPGPWLIRPEGRHLRQRRQQRRLRRHLGRLLGGARWLHEDDDHPRQRHRDQPDDRLQRGRNRHGDGTGPGGTRTTVLPRPAPARNPTTGCARTAFPGRSSWVHDAHHHRSTHADGRYTPALNGTALTYTITATPISGTSQANDGALTITETGWRTWGSSSW